MRARRPVCPGIGSAVAGENPHAADAHRRRPRSDHAHHQPRAQPRDAGSCRHRIRERRRLRTVTVYQSSAAAAVDEADIPPARLAVPGDVSPGRRERLRQMLIQRYRDELPRRPIKLTPDRLAAIAELEHVAAVVPAVNDRAAVTVNGSPRVASLALLAPDHHSIADRIVYGRLPDPVRPELLISESVLFYCGVVADSDVEKFVGQSLRLEVRREPRQAPIRC